MYLNFNLLPNLDEDSPNIIAYTSNYATLRFIQEISGFRVRVIGYQVGTFDIKAHLQLYLIDSNLNSFGFSKTVLSVFDTGCSWNI